MKKKILIIIANEKIRTRLAKLLTRNNFEIGLENSDKNVVEHASNFDPDLIILDGLYFETLIPQIKSYMPNKLVLVWANERDSRLAVLLMESGAIDCVCPPITNNEILLVIEHIINLMGNDSTKIKISKPGFVIPFKKNILMAAAAVCAMIVLLLLIISISSSKIRTFAIDYQNPTGIYCSKDFLWTSDWYTQKVYQYKIGKELKLLKVYSFDEFNPNTIAIIKDFVWTAGTDGFIRTYDVRGAKPILTNKFKSPGYSTSGLFIQDQYLWTTDAENNKIYKHLMSKPHEFISSFNYPGIMPVGIFWDGNNLWSADGKTNKVYRHYGAERNYEIMKSFTIFTKENGILAGMSGDGKYFWFIFISQPGKIVRYPARLLK